MQNAITETSEAGRAGLPVCGCSVMGDIYSEPLTPMQRGQLVTAWLNADVIADGQIPFGELVEWVAEHIEADRKHTTAFGVAAREWFDSQACKSWHCSCDADLGYTCPAHRVLALWPEDEEEGQ